MIPKMHIKSKLRRISAIILLPVCLINLLSLTPLVLANEQGQPNPLWNRKWDVLYPSNIAVGDDGIYVAGAWGGQSPSNATLTKFNFSGQKIWNQSWGGPAPDAGFDVAVENNSVYMVGFTSVGAYYKAFLVKYDGDGNLIWNRTWAEYSEHSYGVAVDGNYIYVVGERSYVQGGQDAFIAKFDAEGNQLWNTTWGRQPDDSVGNGVTVDSSGVFIVGNTGEFAFLTKYDANGNQLWNLTWRSENGWASGQRVAAHDDSIYVTGITRPFDGVDDALLMKYDVNGNQIWNRTWGGSSVEEGFGVAATDSGVYMVGDTYSFGAGLMDAFLARYDIDGNQLWNTTWGTLEYENGLGVTVDSNNIYMVGDNIDSHYGFLVKFAIFSKPHLSDFNLLFVENDVRVIYPSDAGSKPLGCVPAKPTDWTASAYVTTKLGSYVEGLDTDSSFVDQTWGKAVGSRGNGIISFGGPAVNPVLKYAEADSTPEVDRAPVKWYDEGGIVYRFKYSNGTDVPGAEVNTSRFNSEDLFVIEVYMDGDGRLILLSYGFGWKGTYAAGKYFHSVIYPNIDSYDVGWLIVRWEDTNHDTFVNLPGQGDTYTLIASA